MFFDGFLVLLAICMVNSVQAQQYILDPQYHFQAPQDDFYNQNKPLGFQQQFPGFSGVDSYLPQRDLQTSDLPFHLQKTLPQYRFPTKEQLPRNELPYHNNVIFRPDHERTVQNVAPSTHRPNYSHFLLQNHNRNPSHAETFLGQITLDNSFGNLDNYYNTRENRKQKLESFKPIPDKFLRQHTRILAPDPEEKQNRLQENKYFVNENGEVFSTTITPPHVFSSKKLSTKLEIEGENPNSQEFPRYNVIDSEKSSDSSQSDQESNSANNFDLTDYEYEDEHEEKVLKSTSKSKTLIRSTEKPRTNPLVPFSPREMVTEKQIQVKENNFTKKPTKQNNEIQNVKPEFEEPIVSVITTKSVINNTVIATTMPTATSTTENFDASSVGVENSTDSWVVVASVQTSKSISGAHYLPHSIVAQEEKFTLLNEKERLEKLNEEMTTTEEYSSYDDYDNESTTEDFTTQTSLKHSTESLIDKLDRVQSDLSSGLLSGGFKNEDNNIAVITENMTDKIHMSEITESPTVVAQIFPPISKNNIPIIKKFSPHSRPPSTNLYPKRRPQPYKKPSTTTTTQSPFTPDDETADTKEPKIIIAKPDAFLPPGYKPRNEEDSSSGLLADILKKFKETSGVKKNEDNELNSGSQIKNFTSIDSPLHRFGSINTTHDKNETISSNKNETTLSSIDVLLKIAKPVDIKKFLPPGYKADSEIVTTRNIDEGKIKSDNTKSNSSFIDDLLKKTKKDDIGSLLPADFKPSPTSTEKPISSIDAILEKAKQEDISAFLPPGYKPTVSTTTKKTSKIEDILQNSKEDDIAAFLPPGYRTKSSSTTSRSKPKIEDLFEQSKKDDVSAFLPPGYKSKSFTNRKSMSKHKPNIEVENLPTSLLPTGYKARKDFSKIEASTESITSTSTTSTTSTSTTTTGKQGLKVVFPSRPGGKRINHKLTTSKPREEKEVTHQAPVPTIHKGWPTRATTEFTGWPTPSTTPISIEKLLESVQRASPTSAAPENITITTTTQTTVVSTTTTTKPTTPGVCVEECDLVGTIKLVDGVKWVPELLDRNTKEWQLLANEVQTQLEEVYKGSDKLKELFKNLRIDGFSEGSVLVDYLVEMNSIDMHISTSEIKKFFNEALERSVVKSTLREGKSLNETEKYEEKATLGKFIIDPEYTDFIVVPKQIAPTVGYAEDNLLLPQWAIAVIVIGLASLLFVIIFGVTVLVNRAKNAKKKVPTPLTEDMLNELNKNHMGGYDNYGVEDPYSVEAGFWDPRRMDAHREYNRLPKKGSSGSIHDNSMTNLYDSWKSQWNGCNNSTGGYYGHSGLGSSHRLYERRRSYDTNF